jgi:hypothetical protein
MKASEQLNLWKAARCPAVIEGRRAVPKWLSLLTVQVAQHEIRDDGQTNRGLYTVLPFRIEAKGTLAQLTGFLFRFSADYLQGASTDQHPDQGFPGADAGDGREALCKRRGVSDKLPEGKSNGWNMAPWTIIQGHLRRLDGGNAMWLRGLFASYLPRRPLLGAAAHSSAPPKPKGIDPSEFTYVTVINDGRPAVWLFVRPRPGRQAARGRSFEVGTVSGKIAIRIKELEVESRSTAANASAWSSATTCSIEPRCPT